MSAPHQLKPLADATQAALVALVALVPAVGVMAPRHTVNATADPRLVAMLRDLRDAERNLRRMKAFKDAGETMRLGIPARWAKRANDAFAEVSRIALAADDEAFPKQVEIISAGLKHRPLRVAVFIAWTYCSTAGRKLSDADFESMAEDGFCHPAPCIPSAGEVAEIVQHVRPELVKTRDIVNHLKALGLPYASARRGGRKSI